MEPFSQTFVRRAAPDVLRPTLSKSPKVFSAAVTRVISNTSISSPILGVAILLSVQDASLESLALATAADEIFVLHPRNSPILDGINELKDASGTLGPLLRGANAHLVGFGMARISMHIRHGLNTHVRGIELTDIVPPKDKNMSPGAFVKNYVDPCANTFAVDTLWDDVPSNLDDEFTRLEHLALRAWLSVRVAAVLERQYDLRQIAFVDTKFLSSKYFRPIQQMLLEVELIEAARPRVLQNDFKGTSVNDDGHLVIANDRFKNRVRPSERTEVWVIDGADGLHRGTARRANGKLTHVDTRSNLNGVTFKAIFVVGRDEFSHADRAREAFILHLLQGKHVLSEPDYEIIRRLYFPNPDDPQYRVSAATKTGKLNQSQANAVKAMVKSEATFVIVHGPPGTGKTSTISVALQKWLRSCNTVWVVAQSNVAVKNIAERLSKDGVRYRLLVSKEFYHEWHEHIYDDRVKDSLIRTDELPTVPFSVSVLFHEVKIVLCTLSTLSNPSLHTKNIFSFVPVANLVVDEASQIGIFNYMHIFAQFKQLRKVCFFGDPKQLPPFGKESAPTLQSIFDVRHLKSQAYFLNTQYRMPVPVGRFISEAVYDEKLQSEHEITDPSCVAFIDVEHGQEESDKKSFINKREVQTVEHLVRYYYQNKKYCIVTPYDAQRNLLHKTLEASGLRFDNIYNVDSFQGNEADFIIVSVVRTSSPGFLSSRSRVNVMLTRCKLGMVIVTGKAFMHQRNVRSTLLGEMCQYWETRIGQENTWRDWRAVAEKRADLPDGTNKGRRRHGDGMIIDNSTRLGRFDSNLRSSDSARSTLDLHGTGASLSSPVSARTPELELRSSANIIKETSSYGKGSRNFQPPDTRGKASISSLAERLDNISINAAFPPLLSTTRSPSAGGSWARGPPDSSRARATTTTAPRIASQKLAPLKRNVPSEKLALAAGKDKKKWAPLF